MLSERDIDIFLFANASTRFLLSGVHNILLRPLLFQMSLVDRLLDVDDNLYLYGVMLESSTGHEKQH